tara:strand:- start:928 stop:2097 length:1170 start_codon:yes stop_codon:yes gene_type:complete
MNNLKFNQWFMIYLIILYFFASFFLYQKYNNLVEWTISEWLINYQGGFTRRGFIGEIVFQFSKIFSTSLRETILIFQLASYLLYFNLLFKFLKDINKNLLLIFAIYSPLFILYPIAEVEVLARKEIFVFIAFLLFVNVLEKSKFENKHFFYFALILSILTLIWEGVIFYLSFFIMVIIIKNRFILNKSFLIKLILSIVPVFIIFYFIVFFRLTENEVLNMCNAVNECYGAMLYLDNNLNSNVSEVTSQFRFSYLLRYVLIFFIGFLPLLILIKNSKFKDEIKINISNTLPLFVLMFLPNIFFYYIAQDWGRWMNISYTLSLITYLYLYKNNFIKIKKKIINYNFSRNKILLIMFFIVFSFGWSPKTTIKEDVGSIPIYRKTLTIIDYLF